MTYIRDNVRFCSVTVMCIKYLDATEKLKKKKSYGKTVKQLAQRKIEQIHIHRQPQPPLNQTHYSITPSVAAIRNRKRRCLVVVSPSKSGGNGGRRIDFDARAYFLLVTPLNFYDLSFRRHRCKHSPGIQVHTRIHTPYAHNGTVAAQRYVDAKTNKNKPCRVRSWSYDVVNDDAVAGHVLDVIRVVDLKTADCAEGPCAGERETRDGAGQIEIRDRWTGPC